MGKYLTSVKDGKVAAALDASGRTRQGEGATRNKPRHGRGRPSKL